jgi:hypothetical protein
MLYVGLDNNLYFLNDTTTYQLTPTATGVSWLVGGNALASTGFMGSTTAEMVQIGAQSVAIITMVPLTSITVISPLIDIGTSGTDTINIGSNASDIVINGNNFNVLSSTSIGGIPLAKINATNAGGFFMLTAVPLSGGIPNGGTILLGGPSNPDLGNGIDFLSPSNGGAVFSSSLSAGPTAAIFNQGLMLQAAGAIGPVNFGDAAASVITMQNQTTDPTTVGSGFGTIFVGTDNNLYFLNGTATYQLTPSTTPGTEWLTTGDNSGAGLLLGTNTTDGFSIQQNSVAFITLATNTLSIATAGGLPFLNIGNSSLTSTITTDSWTLTAVSAYEIVSPVIEIGASGVASTILIGQFAPGVNFTVEGVNGTLFFAGAGATLDIECAGATTLCTSVAGTLAISNAAMTTTFDATNLLLPNLPAAASSLQSVVWDSGTNKLFAGGAVGSLTWVNVASATQAMVAGTAYISNDGATLVTFTLPATAAVGAEFQVQGNSAGGWSIAQNAGQNIQVGNTSSTVGVGGSVASSNRYDCIRIVCTVANTSFNAEFLVGSLTIT